MAATDLHVHITWDTEPTEEAKSFIRLEVVKALQATFQDETWFAELVKAEVQRELKESGLSSYMHQVPLAAQAELRHLREG
jgi:L-fucose isomerase-like protein